MSSLTDRIRPWTQNPPRNSPAGETAILILEDNGAYNWVAVNAVNIGTFEPGAIGGPHPTRHDAIVDAIEHVPDWNIIRTL